MLALVPLLLAAVLFRVGPPAHRRLVGGARRVPGPAAQRALRAHRRRALRARRAGRRPPVGGPRLHRPVRAVLPRGCRELRRVGRAAHPLARGAGAAPGPPCRRRWPSTRSAPSASTSGGWSASTAGTSSCAPTASSTRWPTSPLPRAIARIVLTFVIVSAVVLGVQARDAGPGGLPPSARTPTRAPEHHAHLTRHEACGGDPWRSPAQAPASPGGSCTQRTSCTRWSPSPLRCTGRAGPKTRSPRPSEISRTRDETRISPPSRGVRDAGGQHHVPAEQVAVARADRLAGVDAESHPHALVGVGLAVGRRCPAGWPIAASTAAPRALEADHEPVALGLHDAPAMAPDRVAHDPVVLAQHRQPALDRRAGP